MKLSAYVITLNEKARLERILQALTKVADEIVIVDSSNNISNIKSFCTEKREIRNVRKQSLNIIVGCGNTIKYKQ